MKLRPLTSPRYVAYPEKDVISLLVKGPRRELEEAHARLGSPATVDVPIPDLEPNEESKLFWLSGVDQLAVPFPARLLTGLNPVEVPINVFRLKESTVRFAPPVVKGAPLGIEYEITLEPDGAVITAPANKVERDVQPNTLDVSDLFEGRGDGYLPPDTRRPLAFDNWRNDPKQGRFRTEVELPDVTATVRFYSTEARKLRNPIVFWGPDGPLDEYEVSVSGGAAEIEQGYYEGQFEGATEDLDRLEEAKTSWWYVVRIPRDKLPTDDSSKDANIQVEYLHTEALDGLRVRFQRHTFTVTIKKAQ